MSKIPAHITVRIARYTCLAAFAGISSAAFALGSTVSFSGAIVEPACIVQPQTLALNLSAPQTDNQIPLNVYCNADQAVRISFQDMGGSTGKRTFSSGVGGAEIAISHRASIVGPGDAINYAFNGKEEMTIPLTASLRKAANIEQGKMRSSVLVSFEYR